MIAAIINDPFWRGFVWAWLVVLGAVGLALVASAIKITWR